MARYENVRDIAALIFANVERRNPTLLWGITAILPNVSGTRQVQIQRQNAVRRAIYLPRTTPIVGGGVFVSAMDNSLGTLVVIASDFQTPWEPTFLESPILLTETDPGLDGVPGTWDDVHYLTRDDDGYYLTEG